ncbi:MAG: hypothetical protein GW892_01160 [Armatimonadetes bacterium]|nr:hypothetical protein [Armatimonadota bacterium]
MPLECTFAQAAGQCDLGNKAAPGHVVHPGEVCLPLGPGAAALPFAEL